MADTAIRVRAGQTVTATLTPASTSGTWTATAKDAAGRSLRASAQVSGANVVVTIAADEWRDGKPGVGRLEVKNVNAGATTYPFTWQIRILPGIDAEGDQKDYPW